MLRLRNVKHLATDVSGGLADGSAALGLARRAAPDGGGVRDADRTRRCG